MTQIEADILAFLKRKYITRADERQKRMKLEYIEAEVHDLAKELGKYMVEVINDSMTEAMKHRA